MNAKYALPVIAFLMADVGGGLGPFLSTWLAEVRKWTPEQIGSVIAAGSLVGALLAAPAGSLVDRLGRPRLMLGVACAAILGGTLLLLPFEAFLIVMAAQIVVAAGGALGAPATSGLTLAVVGKDRFARQQGINESANHVGNVMAAGLIAVLAWMIGPVAAVVVLGVMACATIGVLWSMRAEDVDGDRMRGRKRRQKGEKRGATRAIMKDRRLWTVLAVVFLFQLGSSAMLPLLGQRVVAEGAGNPTAWMSACVIVAQLTMVPVAFAAGRSADWLGRRWLLMAACAVVIARCLLAMFATGTWWLIPIEVLDGLAAATFSVAAPVAIADLTYGSGRTQTAMGTMAMMQAGGAALASLAGGFAAKQLGWAATFGAMAVFPAIAIALLFTVTLRDETGQGQGPKDKREPAKEDAEAAA
jgi:MFS family permease